MADINENAEVNENRTTEDSAKAAPKASPKAKKEPNGFVRFFRKISKFFKDVLSELKKVVWMPKNDVKRDTIIVVCSVIVFAIVIGAIDVAGGKIIDLLAGIVR